MRIRSRDDKPADEPADGKLENPGGHGHRMFTCSSLPLSIISFEKSPGIAPRVLCPPETYTSPSNSSLGVPLDCLAFWGCHCPTEQVILGPGCGLVTQETRILRILQAEAEDIVICGSLAPAQSADACGDGGILGATRHRKALNCKPNPRN